MRNRFAEMDCFVLAGGKRNLTEDFQPVGDITRLEKGYRRYAAIFEKVFLVLKKDQAVEHYLNYPHVCDERPEQAAVIGVRTALEQAESDAVFIGSSEFHDFPLELAVDLVKRYDGELFLGYCNAERSDNHQPLFGIFSRKLKDCLADSGADTHDLRHLLGQVGRLLPLPEAIPGERLGLA
jgi:molybdopterin-guanine dinucleotide biosynthesis protein A